MRVRIRTGLVSVAALVAMAGVGLGAHDFWIEPTAYAVNVGDPIGIHLTVGERFAGDRLARNGGQIEKFVLVGPSGERPVIGRDGMDPAGLLKLDAPGIWFVGYRSKPSSVELTPEKFEDYLRAEGLEHVIDERAAKQESQLPGRERYSRSVKSLLRGGTPASAAGYDKVLGLTLEFVLEADPVTANGKPLPLRLLTNGRPLAGALVVAYKKDAGASSPGSEALRARTDNNGRVVVPMTDGVWLIKAVQMERAAAGSGADWESVWTSLTFMVG